MLTHSSRATSSKMVFAGVDEAGRGALVGPVTVAAVILDKDRPINGLNDSKKLSEKRRNELALQIKQYSLAWYIVNVSHEVIDQINILQASLLGMQKAVEGLSQVPQHVLVDGNRAPDFAMPATAIIGGDASEACIAAASILAKVQRDEYMVKLAQSHPEYGFEKHKGYPTLLHKRCLAEHGACPEHRLSYAPVKQACLKHRE